MGSLTITEPQGRTALIAYGTETGTSQDLSQEVSNLLRRLHFNTLITPLDALPGLSSTPNPASLIRHLHAFSLVVFVVSTTGQGHFPTNARSFWRTLLRKKLGPGTLSGVRCAVVGLGDSSYLKFNWAGRKLGRRLVGLGAEEVVPACEADEQGDDGVEGGFLTWCAGFRTNLVEEFPLGAGQEALAENVSLPEPWELRQAECEGESYDPTPPMEGAFEAILTENTRVTPETHFQDVRRLQLEASSHHDYLPGDAVAIMPQNSPNDVTTLLDLMSWTPTADLPLSFHLTDPTSLQSPPLQLPHSNTTTLRTLLTTTLDITAIPRRSFFAQLANHTSNDFHRERLLEFTDPQYLDEYFDYATRPRRSIVEVLQEFDSVRIPWHQALNVFPVIRPRLFSIASADEPALAMDTTASDPASASIALNIPTSTDNPTQKGTQITLLVAIVKYRTILRRVRQGLATRYLASLPEGTRLQVALKPEGRLLDTHVVVPPAASTTAPIARPYILIGAGTGIAPLRSLLLELERGTENAAPHTTQQDALNGVESHAASQSSTTSPKTLLIFGARSTHADFFFSSDFSRLSSGTLPNFKLITAFSRDEPSGKKIYVQDRIREHAAEIRRLVVDEEATVVVCGSAGAMPRAVRAALVDCLIDGEGEAQAEKVVAAMEREGRYRQETW
jgi:sulfite reductase alpha subunit-like flavoprotein